MLTQLRIRTWRCAGESVKAAFAGNFAKGLEKGAQLVIRVDGEVVVDMCASSALRQASLPQLRR